MLDKKYHSFFLDVYKECNVHAREQATRRDQVIAFYIAVCAFYIPWQNNGDLTFLIKGLTVGIMIIFSIICSLVVINFRSWIIQYGNCSEAVGKLFVAEENLNCREDISIFLSNNARKHKADTFREYTKRMGNMVIIGFILISATPWVLLSNLIQQQDTSRQPAFYMFISFVCVLVHCVLLIRHHYISANEALTRPKELTWIVRFNDICSGKHARRIF